MTKEDQEAWAAVDAAGLGAEADLVTADHRIRADSSYRQAVASTGRMRATTGLRNYFIFAAIVLPSCLLAKSSSLFADTK